MKLVTTLSVSLLLAAYILGVLVAPQSSTVWLYHGAAAQTAGLAWAVHAQTLLLALGMGLLGGAAIMLVGHVLMDVAASLLSWMLLGAVSLVSRGAHKMVFQYVDLVDKTTKARSHSIS